MSSANQPQHDHTEPLNPHHLLATPEAAVTSTKGAGLAKTQPVSATAPAPVLNEPAPLPKRQSRASRFLRTTSTKPHERGSRRKRAEKLAKRTVDKLVSDPSPATQPVPIVAILKGTPYQAPVEATTKSENSARMILDLACDLGGMMLRAGAGSSETEASVIAVCTALGLPNAEVDLTSTALTAHYSDPEGRLLTVVRVTREESIHFAKLSSIHALVTDIVDGQHDYDEVRSRLDSIRQQKRPWAEWIQRSAWGVLAASFINLVGGSPLASLLGFFMAVGVDLCGKYLYRTGLPMYFVMMVQAGTATLVAMVAYTFGLVRSPEYLVAGGIVLLLPTVTLISAVQDALSDFPLTASGKLVKLLVAFSGIVSGIALAIYVGKLINLREVEVLVSSSGIEVLTTLLATIASFLVASMGAIGFQAARRTILWSGTIGLTGFIMYVALSLVGIGNILTCFLAAGLVGMLARPVALKRGSPVIVLLIPSIFPLLQGLAIFHASYEMVQPGDSVTLATGLSSLFAALAANAAIAVGAFLGDFIVRPIIHRRRKRLQEQTEGGVFTGGSAAANADASGHHTD